MEKREFKYLATGELAMVGRGDLFFSYGFNGNSKEDPSLPSFDVFILRLNEREIIFKLIYYTEEKSTGRWSPVPGIRTYTFPLTIDAIDLMGFKFIIMSYEEGRIRYKRIK